jgi:hypothetical protein
MVLKSAIMGRHIGYALLLALVCALLGVAAAPAVEAAPLWKFDGHLLVGAETVLAKAVDERFAIPGLPTECAHATMLLEITNNSVSANGGSARVKEFLNEGCTAGSVCHVERFEAKKLPWPGHLATVVAKNYLVLEGMEIEALYGGPECAFAETPVIIKGSAGGVIESATETITFDKASESATGTTLKVGSSAVEWDALFVTEAQGAHKGEALEG